MPFAGQCTFERLCEVVRSMRTQWDEIELVSRPNKRTSRGAEIDDLLAISNKRRLSIGSESSDFIHVAAPSEDAILQARGTMLCQHEGFVPAAAVLQMPVAVQLQLTKQNVYMSPNEPHIAAAAAQDALRHHLRLNGSLNLQRSLAAPLQAHLSLHSGGVGDKGMQHANGSLALALLAQHQAQQCQHQMLIQTLTQASMQCFPSASASSLTDLLAAYPGLTISDLTNISAQIQMT